MDSWKAIAAHLERSCRTVQRWHLLYKLPVHHMGSRGGGVFAYTDEIDRWFRHDGRRVAAEATESTRGSLIQMPTRNIEDNPSPRNQQELADSPGVSRVQKLIDEAYLLWRLASSSNLRNIAQSFRTAIDLDPLNPEAHAGLSHALIVQGMMGRLSLASAYSSARFAADAAVDLDPMCAEGRCAMAWLKVLQERDWEAARAIFDDLLGSGSASTRLMVGRALLHVAQGNLEAASEYLYGAAGPHVLCTVALGLHAWTEYLAGKYCEVMEHISQADESGQSGPILKSVAALASTQFEPPSRSILYIEHLLAVDPENPLVRGALGYITGRSGDRIKAQEVLRDLSHDYSHAKYIPHYSIALVHIGLDQAEQAVRRLGLSYKDGSIWSLGFASDPALRPLRDEPAFEDFVRFAYPAATTHKSGAFNQRV